MNNSLNKHLTIISYWAPPMIGGPQFLCNLFITINSSDYSIVTSYQNIISQNSNARGTSLNCKYYYYDDSSAKNSFETRITNPKFVYRLRKLKFFGGFFSNYVSFFVLIFLFTRTSVRVARLHKNGMLMGTSDGGPTLITTYLTHLITKQSYTLFLHDIYKGNLLKGFYWLAAKLFEKPILTHAKSVFVTNEATKQFYEKRYGNRVNIHVIQNSSFSNNKSYQIIENNISPKHIIFTGSVGWPQESSVINLINAMAQLKDLPLILDLYVPNPSELLIQLVKGIYNVKILVAQQSEMMAIQCKAFLLILPLSWNSKAPEVIATATPGKFTDYLAAGRPMLIHAPDYAYVSQYTRQHNLGLVVDQNNVNLLADTIRNFFHHPENGYEYVDNALRIFHQNHDARKNSETFTKLLNMV